MIYKISKLIYYQLFLIDLTMISCIRGQKSVSKNNKASTPAESEQTDTYQTVESSSNMPKQTSVNFQDILENDETYNISHYTSSDSGNYSVIQNISVFL
jgi:hypothetical protein